MPIELKKKKVITQNSNAMILEGISIDIRRSWVFKNYQKTFVWITIRIQFIKENMFFKKR